MLKQINKQTNKKIKSIWGLELPGSTSVLSSLCSSLCYSEQAHDMQPGDTAR